MKSNRLSRFAIPYVIWMALFVVAPIIMVVIYAFSASVGGFTLDNFAKMGTYTVVFTRSFKLALLHGDDVDVLRPDDHVHRLVGSEAAIQTGEAPTVHLHHVVLGHNAVDDVGLADEVRYEGVLRLIINILWRSDLLNGALVHDHDGVGHGQSLLLIVGHIDEGDAHLLLDPL